MAQKDLGIVTAYGYAKQNGYTGTEEEFAELLSTLPNIPFNASAASGTDDAKLYAAITALGWQSDVVSGGDIEIKQMLTNILSQFAVTTPTVNVTPAVGSVRKVEARKCGRIVMLVMQIYNNETVASGANLFTGTLQADGCLPIIAATSSAFFGARSINGVLEANGSIVVRNASAAAMATSESSTVGITFVYIAA